MLALERTMLKELKQLTTFFCANCQKEHEFRMTFCYIDYDQADSGGVPVLIGYRCNSCNHLKQHTRHFKAIAVLATQEDV